MTLEQFCNKVFETSKETGNDYTVVYYGRNKYKMDITPRKIWKTTSYRRLKSKNLRCSPEFNKENRVLVIFIED